MKNLCSIILLILSVVCSGCKTTSSATGSIAPDAHYRLEDKSHDSYRHDTTYIDRWHTIKQKGDTVFIHDSIYQYDGEKEKIHDTVFQNNTDTIHVTVYIEKPLSQKDTFFIKSGKILWWVVGALVIGLILAIFIRRR